jgi:3-phenylpropionate/trans-cinnamate dioxygenase ferredoxin subunit
MTMERLRAAALTEIPAGRGHRVDIAGHRIALFRIDDVVYAIADRCSHAEASLAEGDVFDTMVECPRHGSEFDLITGEPGALPATRPVAVYPTEVDGDDVFVTLEPLEEDSNE